MKKLVFALAIALIFGCANEADRETTSDSAGNINNANVYDSFQGKRDGDTSSYEQMPNKLSDTTPQ